MSNFSCLPFFKNGTPVCCMHTGVAPLIVQILLRHCFIFASFGGRTKEQHFHGSHLQSKEDEQQRNWMLHEDEPLILRNMEKLCLTLKNANEEIRYAGSRGVEGGGGGAGLAGKEN